jgi:hypothetical protein
MSDFAGALQFTGFVGAGVFLVSLLRRVPSESQQRALVSVFLAYVLIVSFGNGVLQLQLWPFSSWGLVPGAAPAESDDAWSDWRVVGVTADGGEHLIDYRAFEPLNAHELGAWMLTKFALLTREQQDRVGVYLFRLINTAREKTIAGNRPGYLRRYLGPFVAPAHVLYAPGWSAPGDAPSERFVAIRWYREVWNLDVRYKDPTKVSLVLLYQYPTER